MTGLYWIHIRERKASIMQQGNHNERLNSAQVAYLSHSVATIDAEIRSSDVLGSIAKQEGHGTHQVLRCTHLASGNERGPLVTKLGVLVEDLAGSE